MEPYQPGRSSAMRQKSADVFGPGKAVMFLEGEKSNREDLIMREVYRY